MKAYREAVDRFTQVGDIRRAAGNEVNLADAYNRLGDYAKAKVALQDGLEHCRAVGNRPMEGYALLNLGYAHLKLGETTEALAALGRASTLAHKIREVRLDLIARVYRARALLGTERPRELAAAAERLAWEAERQRVRPFAVTALAIAAEAAFEGGEINRARELAMRALDLRDELGGIEEDEAEVYLVAARALAGHGEVAGAEDVLKRGRARLAEVAAGIEDIGLREQFLGVEANARLLGS
jgi:tetratricopeptide (TPR) repeat protein